MNPIGERLLWLALGFGLGWLACWWRFTLARKRERATVRPTPAPAPAVSGATNEETRVPAMQPMPSSRLIDVTAARAAGFNMKHASDLTVIEGIGPRIHDLLGASGIESFVQLAQLHADELRDILDRGGPNFQLADPATWAEQALLAADNRWTELKRLQNERIGGEPGHAT